MTRCLLESLERRWEKRNPNGLDAGEKVQSSATREIDSRLRLLKRETECPVFVTGRSLDSRQALIVGRIFTVVFILLAGALAPVVGRTETIYVFIQTALSMFQGPTLAILLIGIIWRRATRWGGLAGLVLGVIFTTILSNIDDLFPSDDPFLFVAWWSFVFSCIVTVVVSLLTRPEPPEKIRGLVWGQVMKDAELQSVLNDRVS